MKYFYYLRLAITVTCMFTASMLTAQQKKPAVYYPQPGNREHRSAASMGLDSSLLQEAIAWAQAHESKEPRDLKKAHYLGAFGREPFGYPVGPLKERGPQTGVIERALKSIR